METYAWCFTALLFTSVKAQLYVHGHRSYYEAPEILTSSQPHILQLPRVQFQRTPLPLMEVQRSPFRNKFPRAPGPVIHVPRAPVQMKQVLRTSVPLMKLMRDPVPSVKVISADASNVQGLVVYLTPTQAASLKSSGAIVKPYPRLEPEFNPPQHYYNEANKNVNNYKLNFQKNQKRYGEPVKVYKTVTHSINRNEQPGPKRIRSAMFPESTPQSALTTIRQSTDYVPHASQKIHQVKTKQGRNIRYLPNWERDTLKREPLYSEPLILVKTEKPTLNIPEKYEIPNDSKFDEPEAIFEIDPPAHSHEVVQIKDGQEDVVNIPKPDRVQKSKEIIESLTNTTDPTKIMADLDKLSQVLMPLIKHRSIGQDMKYLLNEEKILQSKLEEIRKSSMSGDLKHAIEVENFKTNLKIRNALAEIIKAVIGLDKENEHNKNVNNPSRSKRTMASMPPITQMTEKMMMPKKMRPAPLKAMENKPFLAEPLPMEKINTKLSISMGMEVQKQMPAPFANKDNNIYIQRDDPCIDDTIQNQEIQKCKFPTKEVMKVKPTKSSMKRQIRGK